MKKGIVCFVLCLMLTVGSVTTFNVKYNNHVIINDEMFIPHADASVGSVIKAVGDWFADLLPDEININISIMNWNFGTDNGNGSNNNGGNTGGNTGGDGDTGGDTGGDGDTGGTTGGSV